MTEQLTRTQIRKNRETVIKYLMEPERQKVTGMLETFSEPECRCCLGHMSHVLGAERGEVEPDRFAVKRVTYDSEFAWAPPMVIQKLALNDDCGTVKDTDFEIIKGAIHATDCVNNFSSLSEINDSTEATPQMIGAYLQTVIEGGAGTPWKSLYNFPEVL